MFGFHLNSSVGCYSPGVSSLLRDSFGRFFCPPRVFAYVSQLIVLSPVTIVVLWWRPFSGVDQLHESNATTVPDSLVLWHILWLWSKIDCAANAQSPTRDKFFCERINNCGPYLIYLFPPCGFFASTHNKIWHSLTNSGTHVNRRIEEYHTQWLDDIPLISIWLDRVNRSLLVFIPSRNKIIKADRGQIQKKTNLSDKLCLAIFST